MFGKIYGIVENVMIKYLKTQLQLSSDKNAARPHVGAIGGYLHTNAQVVNTYVYNSTFNADIFQLTCGGIVGVNFGGVVYCYTYYVTMKVSGRAGGLVGENGGLVRDCDVNSLTLTHYWYDNTFTGGVVGWNTNNGTVKGCISSGIMIWHSPEKGSHIYPSMGKIIGRNSGTYSGCSSTISKDISYYYYHFIPYYDQDKYCFKVDNELVGRQD